MKALMCENCGAPLNENLKCEYCGTQYIREKEDYDAFSQPVIYRVEHPEVKVLRSIAHFDCLAKGRMSGEDHEQFVKRQIARQISEAILPFVEFKREFDPRSMTEKVQGTVRFIEPEFRF